MVARLLEDGDFAVGVFNLLDGDYRFIVGFDEMGITTYSGMTPVLYEVFTGEKAKLTNRMLNINVEGHGCRLYRCHLERK